MTLLMTCWTSRLLCSLSGSTARGVMSPRRGKEAGLAGLDAVLRAGLLAVRDARGVQRAPHDLVAHAGKVLDATASYEHHRVLLEVVSLARDVGGHLHSVREPH